MRERPLLVLRERAPRVEGEGPPRSVLRERASVLRARPPPLEGEGAEG